MSLTHLYDDILTLTDEVEKLLKQHQEQDCASLLVNRQQQLELLAQQVASREASPDYERLVIDYRDFLIKLQQRDKTAIQDILTQQDTVISAQKYQMKSNKALNAYKKFTR